jgi:hypothetical protein
MAELVKEGKTRFISLSECSAESLRRGSAVHPLASLQMEYSLFSRDAEEHGQIDACRELGTAMMAYAVLGRGMLSAQVPKVEELGADDIRARLPRFHSANLEKNLPLRSALEVIARGKNATLAQLSIAWPMKALSATGASLFAATGVAAAFGAASCCALPMLLGSLGLGSAWLASLAFLAGPYRAVLLAAAIVCLVSGGGLLLWHHQNALVSHTNRRHWRRFGA